MTIHHEIRELAAKYASALKLKTEARVEEMIQDDSSHFLIYQVLGVPINEGVLIDVYQNKDVFFISMRVLFSRRLLVCALKKDIQMPSVIVL